MSNPSHTVGYHTRQQVRIKINKQKAPPFTISLSYIACVGENIRLDNGQMVDNMMQEIHMKVLIQRITLVKNGEDAVYPQHQTKIGKIAERHGYIGSSTVIWNEMVEKCQKSMVSKVEMETADMKIFFNHAHMIQITMGEEFYDNDCRIHLTKTDLPNIYVADASTHKKSELKQMNSNSIHLDSHYTTQLRFLGSEIIRQLQKTYSFTTSPLCQKIMSGNTQITTRIDRGRFIKNIGDVSLLFQCSETAVTHRNTSRGCSKQLPVLDKKLRKWFLDPQTRILLKDGARTRCNAVDVPVYKNKDEEYIAPVMIECIKDETAKGDSFAEETGIYPEDVVQEWLDSAYLQHFNEIAYVAIYENICQRTECGKRNIASEGIRAALGSYYDKAEKTILPGFFLGIDIASLGSKCSIAVVITIIISFKYQSIMWFMRFAMLKDDDSTTKASLFRSCCIHMYLIAKAQGKE